MFLGFAAISVGSHEARSQVVLHEQVAAPSLRCRDGVCQSDGARDSSLPDAVMSEDGMIGAPLSGRNPQEHEQVFSSANQSSPASELMHGDPPPGQPVLGALADLAQERLVVVRAGCDEPSGPVVLGVGAGGSAGVAANHAAMVAQGARGCG